LIGSGGSKALKMLHISDIHIDTAYSAYSETHCQDSYLCCHKSDNQTLVGNAGYWGSMAFCDLPVRTVDQTIKYIFEQLKPDFVIWTGDSMSHDVEKQNQQNQTLNQKIVADIIK
jgi:sphingomyelin phosphodiesterase